MADADKKPAAGTLSVMETGLLDDLRAPLAFPGEFRGFAATPGPIYQLWLHAVLSSDAMLCGDDPLLVCTDADADAVLPALAGYYPQSQVCVLDNLTLRPAYRDGGFRPPGDRPPPTGVIVAGLRMAGLGYPHGLLAMVDAAYFSAHPVPARLPVAAVYPFAFEADTRPRDPRRDVPPPSLSVRLAVGRFGPWPSRGLDGSPWDAKWEGVRKAALDPKSGGAE